MTGASFVAVSADAGSVQEGACRGGALEFKLSEHNEVSILQSWRYILPVGGTINTTLAHALPNGSAWAGTYHPFVWNKYVDGWVGPSKTATERLATAFKVFEGGALFGFEIAAVTE
jgi:hypothetical protein